MSPLYPSSSAEPQDLPHRARQHPSMLFISDPSTAIPRLIDSHPPLLHRPTRQEQVHSFSSATGTSPPAHIHNPQTRDLFHPTHHEEHLYHSTYENLPLSTSTVSDSFSTSSGRRSQTDYMTPPGYTHSLVPGMSLLFLSRTQ